MEILASSYFLLPSPLSPKSFTIRNPSPKFPSFSRLKPKPSPIPSSISPLSSVPPTYGGWDDLALLEDPQRSVNLDPVRRFLSSLGFDDPTHAVAFFLGFLSALAISRVRFSSIVVIPVSVLVFAFGFSAGAARVRIFGEKVNDLRAFLNDLASGLERGGDLRLDCLDAGKIKGFVEAIEGVKKNVEGSIVGEILNKHLDLNFDLDGAKRTNSKYSSKRKKEFDFIQYFTDLFQENVIGTKAPKMKDDFKGEQAEQLNSVAKMRAGKESVLAQDYGRAEESELLFNKNLGKFRENNDNGKAIKMMNSSKSLRAKGGRFRNDSLSYEEELNNMNRNFRYMSKQETFERTVFNHNYERRSFQSDNSYSTDSGIDFFTAKSKASSILKESLHVSDKTYDPSNISRSKNQIREVPESEGKKGNFPSSQDLVDEEFNQYMKEATGLLKRARECMKSQADEEIVDSILYKSAKLLCTAEAVRPMSLLAVGQLGNTYLLHGELKLKISRELRTVLLGSDQAVQFEKSRTRDLRRGDVESTLVEVCEECEELLIQAGRKYRTALSIDGSDARALYNWGLALSFRAQLIADVGPEAALDADKIYLAAIDKFDAMMSRSNNYASDALYRWGVVLQERSYLRPRNKREKVKLLHQAKSLFEDVLSVDSDNLQVREALVSCVSELNYYGKL